MDRILDGLNIAQRTAATSPADVLQILAPPGSGKTRTLTSRVAYLLSHYNYQPWNILCLTFTIKSSREMKERIASLVGNGLEKQLILGTFHSVCRRYLVSYGHLISVRKGFGIADSSDSLAIIKRIVKRLGINIEPTAARSRISSLKARGITYEELAREGTKGRNVDRQELNRIYEAYDNQLYNSNLLDYDDLLLRCVDLLRQHPSCVSNVEAVLIDEFQDTNTVQFDLMRLFAAQKKRITTVGDPDQSIYGWRSAEVKNLKRMQKQYPDTLVLNLEENYRSSGTILLASLGVIQQDESRPSKFLLPTHGPGTSPVLRRLPSTTIEALWIVSEVKRAIGMTSGLLTYSDFAVLLRSASLSRHIESAMGKIGIPYRIVGGQRFFDRVEIKILLDYLRVVSQPDNNDALARIINVPSRRIGEPTIKALLEEAETKTLTLWKLICGAAQGNIVPNTRLSKIAEQGLSGFSNIILSARKKLQDVKNPCSPKHLLQYILKKLDFDVFLERNHPEDHEMRRANVEELVAQACEYSIDKAADFDEEIDGDDGSLPYIEGLDQEREARSEETLARFLANVALTSEVIREEKEEANGGGGEPTLRVTISTIHAAKGLEWPIVFIPAAYQGSIPHSRAEDSDEERRLLYVAMTRAQAMLYMSCPTRNSQREETVVSPFLSSKDTACYLDDKGPSFSPGIVQDISRILRRPCPSLSDLTRASTTVENIEDNLWPTNGEDNPELVASETERLDRCGSKALTRDIAAKRRKIIMKGNMTDDSTYSTERLVPRTFTNLSIAVQDAQINPNDAHGFDFVSATLHLRHADRQDGVSTQAQGSTSTANVDQIYRGRGSLMSYLTRDDKRQEKPDKHLSPWNVPGDKDSQIIHRKPLTADVNSNQATRQINKTQASDLVSLPIPRPLAEHRIRSVSTGSKPEMASDENLARSKHYCFLSSSPSKEPREYDKNLAVDKHVERERIFADDASDSRHFRPAAISHTTSLAQLQAANTAPRRTLGVKRSMTGWSNRGPGFSAPSRGKPNA